MSNIFLQIAFDMTNIFETKKATYAGTNLNRFISITVYY